MRKPPEPWTSPTGLVVVDLLEPEGRPVEPGDEVAVHYELSLQDGPVIDSSRDRGEPIRFTVGQHQVMAGLEEAVTGMAPGAIRRVTTPPELAYGEAGAGAAIPPNATLNILIELMNVTPASGE
jgi:FKBP-type peptidyl-prolyl cis-trans isomerase